MPENEYKGANKTAESAQAGQCLCCLHASKAGFLMMPICF